MAKSQFEYVRAFEEQDSSLPNTWMVVRLDGRGFHRFSSIHGFVKPNDQRALNLMNTAAAECMQSFPDIVLAYGESDEMSSAYVLRWPGIMKDENGEITPLQSVPHFDGRVVCYPTVQNLRDYLSWRQADCHINNLYNTVFWALVQKKSLAEQEAEKRLRGTLSSDKNEILFSECGINYNNEPQMYRKGSLIIWEDVKEEVQGLRPLSDGTKISVTSVRTRRIPKGHHTTFNASIFLTSS
eukprot:gene6592-7531_t